MTQPLIGAIADDLTGATDLGLTLVKQGMTVVQMIGCPDDAAAVPEADAVIVAMKTRTIDPGEAVRLSRRALEWLTRAGAHQILFKYCSTFDSTARGNIGPVADALLDALAQPLAVVCPAFPTTGRTIYQGRLFVGDVPLDESSMRDHPLTPMRDASLVRLMRAQSRHEGGLVDWQTVRRGREAIRHRLDELARAGARYAVVDAIEDDDLRTIGAAIAGDRLITGGSGIALGLPDNFRRRGLLPARPPAAARFSAPTGRAAVLSGSCSTASRRQVALAGERMPAFKIEPARLSDGTMSAAAILAWARPRLEAGPVLIYATAEPDEVRAVQNALGRERAGDLIERTLGDVARGLVDAGVARLIVAGGETSGAAMRSLGVEALEIGPEIDPGVPWTRSVGGGPDLALALKSGNFGAPDFFAKALGMLA